MKSGEFVEKVVFEYDFAKEQGFDSIDIIVETSGRDYDISEYEGGFINDNLNGVYSELDEIASDLFNLIEKDSDTIKCFRIK